jgi:hypothetical protein
MPYVKPVKVKAKPNMRVQKFLYPDGRRGLLLAPPCMNGRPVELTSKIC